MKTSENTFFKNSISCNIEILKLLNVVRHLVDLACCPFSKPKNRFLVSKRSPL